MNEQYKIKLGQLNDLNKQIENQNSKNKTIKEINRKINETNTNILNLKSKLSNQSYELAEIKVKNNKTLINEL
jgi:hypothetical protein